MQGSKKVVRIPYNAHTIRVIWNRLFIIVKAKYSKIEKDRKRHKLKRRLQDYIDVFQDEYLAKIGSKAQRALNENRSLKDTENIIHLADIKIYYEYLHTKRNEH